MTYLRKLLRLAPSERFLLAEALFFLICIRLGLYVLPFGTVRRLTRSSVSATRRKPERAVSGMANRLVWAVRVSSKFVPAATCLTRAIAVRTLLGRRGYDAQIHIGVAKSEDRGFHAHAWVELDGSILIGGPQSSGYTPVLSFDS